MRRPYTELEGVEWGVGVWPTVSDVSPEGVSVGWAEI